jgi:hypothetical protein
MSTTPPDDVAELFGLEPLPDSSQSEAQAAAAMAAEEAALAAELAAAMESGDFAPDAPDSRTDRRVKVSWPARMHLPDGQVIELEVRDVSQGGVGLRSDVHIPASTVVGLELDVPPLDQGGSATPVKGIIRTTYMVAHGPQIIGGATWQAPPAGMPLVIDWIRRLRD